MNVLVQSLATMSGLRDRDALDFALVRLVLESSKGAITSARLIRVVGEGSEQRCLTRARLASRQAEAERDAVWIDWNLLPYLSDFAQRQEALARGYVVKADARSGGGACTTVLPLSSAVHSDTLLEVDSPEPLTAQALELVQGVLLHYQNLLGLLDYGEKDALTELLNRKTFDGAFFKATAGRHTEMLAEGPERRAYPSDGGFWLAVLDIDHFKRVNDDFGHLIGDEVLLLLARLMRANFRFHDQLYRFGGEEFVILMRCVGESDAQVALERMRKRVQEHVFPQVGTITVSIGFSSLRKGDTPGDAFGRADKAVYYAKEHGRNQVCNYQALVQAGHLAEEVAPAMDVDLF